MATIPTPAPDGPARTPEQIHDEITALSLAGPSGAETGQADTVAWLSAVAARHARIVALWWELTAAAAAGPEWAHDAAVLAHAHAADTARWWAREAADVTAQAVAWVAVARRGVEAHRVATTRPRPLLGPPPPTVCGRSTRTGELTTPAEAAQRWQATWCGRCWPTTPQVGFTAVPGGVIL